MRPGRRAWILGVAACSVLAALGAGAQRLARLPRVAIVFGSILVSDMMGPDPLHPYARAIVHGLRDLGFVEGRNILIERRSAEGHPDRLPALMQEVVALDVDVIVTTAGTEALRATDRIPIVAAASNALDAALIRSLARPGGNLTGIGENNPAIYGKQLQLLKEAAPAISRVAVITYRPAPDRSREWRTVMETAARELRLRLLWVFVDAPEELDAAFATIVREHADALYADGNHVNYAHRQRIADFALKQRLPSFGFAEEGMLMLYEADFEEALRRLPAFVKKILDGAKPADLPFEQPTKYELVINLKTASALGLTISPSLLQRADQLIR